MDLGIKPESHKNLGAPTLGSTRFLTDDARHVPLAKRRAAESLKPVVPESNPDSTY